MYIYLTTTLRKTAPSVWHEVGGATWYSPTFSELEFWTDRGEWEAWWLVDGFPMMRYVGND